MYDLYITLYINYFFLFFFSHIYMKYLTYFMDAIPRKIAKIRPRLHDFGAGG